MTIRPPPTRATRPLQEKERAAVRKRALTKLTAAEHEALGVKS